MESIIKVDKVIKKFGSDIALSNISIEFERGKIYGIIGRNGAGKTVLFKTMIGFLKPTRGRVIVDGKEIGKDTDFADNIGIIIETPGFLSSYSGYKNLEYLASIKNMIGEKEIKESMERVGLDPNSKKKVGKYSLGMRQRLGIAQAIMENPDILILDEPMNGLDNQGVEDVREILLNLKDEGKSIILASHNKEDMPTTLYSLYKCTKLTYEQFVLAMLKEKSVVIRNMLKEDSEKESRGYVLSFSAMIILYKLGVSTKKLNENGVVIPASILQFSKDEAKTIVDTNARDMVASMGVYEGKLFVNETPEEEKQYWMEESVKIKDYAEELTSIDNYADVNCEEFSNHNLKDLFGICDYDAMAISKKQKKDIIVGEATLIIISQVKGIGIYTVDIVNFLINIKEPVKNIIRYMKQMLELRLMVIINKRTVDYISEYYLTAGEKEQEEILIDWDEFLAGVELVGKEYKSIFTQISTDIMRSKFSESETYESDVWKIFARYVFHYNGFFFRYGFNENGEFEIRTYKRVEDAEE